MGRFEFRKNEIELDIAGVQVFVPSTPAFADRLRQIGEEMVSFGQNMESAEQAEGFMLGVLDELLGEAVMDQIEGERKLDIYDCCDLFRYITDEVKKYHENRTAAYQPRKDVPPAKPSADPIPMAQGLLKTEKPAEPDSGQNAERTEENERASDGKFAGRLSNRRQRIRNLL